MTIQPAPDAARSLEQHTGAISTAAASELLEKKGHYYQLWCMQGGEEDES